MWDIWPRNSREQLAAFLRRHADEFAAEGVHIDPPSILHPIHGQVISFERHAAVLKSVHVTYLRPVQDGPVALLEGSMPCR